MSRVWIWLKQGKVASTNGLDIIASMLIVINAGRASAWSWSWGSDQSGSNLGWGSDNSGGSSGSSSGDSGSNSGGSSWGWGWSSDGEDTNWGWGSSSGPSGTGSTHHNHTAPSNHSSGTSSKSNNHTTPAPSNGSTSTSNSHHNHKATLTPRRKIVISVWKNGFDYQEWPFQSIRLSTSTMLFFFKYNNNEQTQSKTKYNNKKNDVYLIRDLKSYKRCDVSRGKKLAARESSSSSCISLRHSLTTWPVETTRTATTTT